MRIEEFDYELPQELIAQRPAAQRGASRLLHLNGANGAISDHQFTEFPQFVREGDLIVLNDTRVIRARLLGKKDPGGSTEIVIDRLLEPRRALALIRSSRAPKPGQAITLNDGLEVQVVGRRDDLFELVFGEDVLAVLDRFGRVPLPPYIKRQADEDDERRYQTVFAREPGAVAAPTAGLHFDADMLGRLQCAGARIGYVTLHVGAGTFQPVRVAEIGQHVMHSEWYRIPEATVSAVKQAHAGRGRVLAVGTTSLRALESAALGGALES
ncbi:MAG: tRNA preQ1(34) S-adenosylmethionine ribosyltransferase-isomerase QueA, partial [Burkholderiales bacterium]